MPVSALWLRSSAVRTADDASAEGMEPLRLFDASDSTVKVPLSVGTLPDNVFELRSLRARGRAGRQLPLSQF